ncbi:MAG: sensor domain-containing diguanylate cyclase [Acidobacteriota bacterium]|nr:sensor domain-containing diguanylate cyclase [Acidobacteriota bacterium]
MSGSVPTPDTEELRLDELRSYDVLDTLPEQAYDDITHLASHICGCPIALVSLIDEDRQWFKSKLGLAVDETPRDLAFCAHAILEPDHLMVVPDATSDERFAKNPLVISDPSIRFYAGAPLRTSTGSALGTLCVIDTQPRDIDADQRNALLALSRQVMAQLELRRTVASLERHAEERRGYQHRLEAYQRELEENNALLAKRSTTDALTGLKNRRAFFDQMDQEISRAKRHEQLFSLALADIDRFKSYNDTFGHPEGDEALKTVARAIENESRSSDYVARYGGEEFTIVLSNTSIEGAIVLAERFRRAVEQAAWEKRPVTISLGVATWEADMTSDDLIGAADRALFRAKRAGRNRVVRADSGT